MIAQCFILLRTTQILLKIETGEPLRKRQLLVVFRLAGRKMCKLALLPPSLRLNAIFLTQNFR